MVLCVKISLTFWLSPVRDTRSIEGRTILEDEDEARKDQRQLIFLNYGPVKMAKIKLCNDEV